MSYFIKVLKHSVEKRKIHCHTNFFRQINLEYIKVSSKTVSLTKFLQHNEMKNLLSLENISSNQLNNFFTYHREKMLLSRNFCQKQCGNKIRKFPHCDIPKTPISKCTGVPGTFVKTIPTLKRLNNFVFS